MSHSYKHTPKGGVTTARSEKYEKTKANRIFRRDTRQAIKSDAEPPSHKNEISDVWGMAKDGKHYFGKHIKKDPEFGEKFMRK